MPVCPVHNLRAECAVPYHSFHTQSACHCHVTSGGGWDWTSSWRLWDTGRTCTPSPPYELSCVAPDLVEKAHTLGEFNDSHKPHLWHWMSWRYVWNMTVCVPVLIWEDFLTVFAFMDGLIAVFTFLFEVLSQCVKDGARTGAWILLMPPQLKCRREQLIAVFTAVHLLVCMNTQIYLAFTWRLFIV